MRTNHAVARIRACVLLSVVASAGCARTRTPAAPTELTRAEYVEDPRRSEPSAAAIRRGAYEQAYALADRAVRSSPAHPWAHYDRAVALHHLGRTDEAVRSYREAERRFADHDAHGRGISIWGRARALADAGRCEEASAAYREYADLVAASDPASARLALEHAKHCRPVDRALGDPSLTRLTSAVLARDWLEALAAADAAGPAARESGWVDYNRAIALQGLGRTEEAIAAYRAAEEKFGSDVRPRSLAIYGRARALHQANRCPDALHAYGEYTQLVREHDPDAARIAADVARDCLAP